MEFAGGDELVFVCLFFKLTKYIGCGAGSYICVVCLLHRNRTAVSGISHEKCQKKLFLIDFFLGNKKVFISIFRGNTFFRNYKDLF